MITFREHIEISNNLSEDRGLSDYIESLEPSKRIRFIRDVKEVYPLSDSVRGHFDAMDRFKCYFKVDELVLGQFIMIEQIITGKTKYESDAENDFALAQLLMRPRQHEVFDNEDPRMEQQNSEAILNTDVREVYTVLKRYLDDREFVLFKQFKGVFYEINEDEDPEDTEEELERTGKALFQQQWYWYSMVRMLAQEDITRYEEIYMLKMNVVMPEMSYLAQKNKIEAAEQRQASAMRKL